MGYQKILLPLDESERDALTIEHVANVAAPGATICLYSVVTPIVIEVPTVEPRPALSAINTSFGVGDPPQPTYLTTMPHPEHSRNRLTYLHALATALTQKGFDAYAEIGHGKVVDSIVATAQNGFELLVMATHCRGGLGRVVYGSVADAVLHRAPCPVLLLPIWL
jgi:nucleotide-binding universal stress UspA family protein